VDEGGLSQEFFRLFCKAISSPGYGIFVRLSFERGETADSKSDKLIGRLLAIGFVNRAIVPVRFPLRYEKLNALILCFRDLRQIDR
jgi:hypothetical protein